MRTYQTIRTSIDIYTDDLVFDQGEDAIRATVGYGVWHAFIGRPNIGTSYYPQREQDLFPVVDMCDILAELL